MDQLNLERTCDLLNKIVELELAGVVRLYSLRVDGDGSLPSSDRDLYAGSSERVSHTRAPSG